MRGIHKTDDLDMWFDKMGGLMVLDDLMEEGGNDKCVLDLLTTSLGVCHKKILVFVSLHVDI